MGYYQYKNKILYTEEPFPGVPLERLPPEGEVFCLLRREPLAGRDAFRVSDGSLLACPEGVGSLVTPPAGRSRLPEALEEAIRAGRVLAVNANHPRWEELLELPEKEKYRVHLLALGDVGSTLAMGLKLLGGDVIDTLGICDLRENVPERWEFELGQIATPAPRVEIVQPEDIFRCDVFLFCASRFVPDTAVKNGDVRMAQYEFNRPLVASYARQAREAGFKGMFCVVSDPVDPLCRAALLESNRNGDGELDFQGLFPHQVRGFGLGVMNARARYYAERDARFADFLTDGRAFGPHGEGLIIANSISRYDDALSRELTEKTKHANLDMRALGYKPYVAPALSSGALSVLALLRGQWHCASLYLDGVFLGVRSRGLCEVERLPLPEALQKRIAETMEDLRAIQ